MRGGARACRAHRCPRPARRGSATCSTAAAADQGCVGSFVFVLACGVAQRTVAVGAELGEFDGDVDGVGAVEVISGVRPAVPLTLPTMAMRCAAVGAASSIRGKSPMPPTSLTMRPPLTCDNYLLWLLDK